ncbi:alpha-1,3-mannosyl-glycoprotein 4-beta-N-acetylglucosaminyltransferase B-like isoform X2 [Xenia sp. Carnegie-2017]|uniref:alpha-1,3-mannosyl-glycoprotein 4-beta-N-acetylglucosaminyltransferase B-like isoform X2 n=1 Tax=Xenia sp. Carnegie-2017 TaxID=2897299 RepID=UPI001F046E46|nr:alpha-1,3-mannosyl-glycoprotein 4-beta-N-acetylglucosaminyltransferase B-like isoform X2 [Xenia sp. Carnegie-2017]
MAFYTVRRNRIFMIIALFFIPVLLLLIRSNGSGKVLRTAVEVDPSILIRMKEMSARLRSAESKNDAVAQTLISLRESSFQSSHKKSTNKTSLRNLAFSNNKELTLPSIYNYMSHLLKNPKSLVPEILLSAGRSGVSLAFGVPTIKRNKASYVLDTIQSLLHGLSPNEEEDCIIIIFIAEIDDKEFVLSLIEDLRRRFGNALRSGLLEVVVPPKDFYPDLDNLPKDITFHDPPSRVKWRTKQNLDFSYLMMFAQQRAMFYIQLEDDLIATPGYVSTIRTFALQQTQNRWMILEFSSLGFIGKLFRTSDLPMIVEFFLMFHKDKPVDWLLDHILWVKVCNPDKDQAHCNREKAQLRIRLKPSLFQHIGKESSLPGKRQNLVDKDFKKSPLFQAHLNPKATAITTINVYQSHSIERAYTGQTYFWGYTPHKGDVVRFKFVDSLILEHFRVKTGNVEHPGDIFSNASIELLTTENKLKRDKC